MRARDLTETIPGDCVLAANHSYVFPDSEDMMSWKIGNNGFQMSLSSRLPGLIKRELKPWLEAWLNEQGLAFDEVQSWAIHPGGPRILKACEEALDLPDQALDASWGVLDECGNMSSPTVLFILQRLQEMKTEVPCVMLGFGPGITAEVTLWI